MNTVPYSTLSEIVKQVDEINAILDKVKQSREYIVVGEFDGMRIKGRIAEVMQFAFIRELTERRANLLNQINGRIIDEKV